jgi:hypothetical protein
MSILQTDYYQEAFGGLDSWSDHDAAIKIALNNILMSRLFVGDECSLMGLLVPDNGIGGFGGDPGWVLSRIPEEGESWPEWADFRAYVVPEEYELAYPEFFMTKAGFFGYVRKALRAFLERNPDEITLVSPVISVLDILEKRENVQEKIRAFKHFARDLPIWLVLSSIFEKQQFDQFACLLTAEHTVNRILDESNWEIKRCDSEKNCPSWVWSEYVKWPLFHVHVNPEMFYLKYHKSIRHESAKSERSFHEEIEKNLRDFLEDNPSEIVAAQPVIAILEANGISLKLSK